MIQNILAIDDDQDALANMRDILELDGYPVTGAGSLKEATYRRSWSDYSVVLIDRKLPDGNADAILPFIRQAAPRTAVIVITGHAELAGTVTALRCGVTDYLLKPINAEMLRTAVSRALKMREMEDCVQQAQRLAAIGQMTTVLSHESGNVLSRIQGLLELLADEVQQHEEAISLVDRLKKAQGELRHLYDEVSNYAAPLTLERELWELRSIWRQAWGNLAGARHLEKRASLIEQNAGENFSCEVDNFRLDQVFRNLFENSLAACSDPVRVEIRCSDAKIDGRAAVQIVVRDNGPGIPPNKAQKVFEPFYTTKQKGTGLGMAIVKRIIEAHGGSIVIGSDFCAGAEFVITLPRKEPTED